MGKVEILTLIAGVVLSVALALIVVPMFGNSDDLVKKQKIRSEIIGIKNAFEIYNKTKDYDLFLSSVPNKKSGDSIDNLVLWSKNLENNISFETSYTSTMTGLIINNIQNTNFKELFGENGDDTLQSICPYSDFTDQNFYTEDKIRCVFEVK